MLKQKVFLTSILIIIVLTAIAQGPYQNLVSEAELLKSSKNYTKAADAYNKLALLYWENEAFQNAIDAFNESIVLNKETGNENAIKAIYSNIGMIYTDMGQPETSILFFRKSLIISKNQNKKQDIATTLINIATSLNMLNRVNEGIEVLLEAKPTVEELNNPNLLRTLYGLFAELYEKAGESAKSMEYYNLYLSFQKAIAQQEIEQNQKEMATLENEKNVAIADKKRTELTLGITQDSLNKAEIINEENRIKMELQSLIIKQKESELENQRLWTLVFILSASVLGIFVVFVFIGYRQKQKHNIVLEYQNAEIAKQNEEIKAKNLKISQSINYAKTIQGALLPGENLLKEMYPESFVLFSPRDVVSGDFYWYYKTNEPFPKFILAAVDCTGHGVPGAFMSMLGMSFIEEIVVDKGETRPVQILEQMHQTVKLSLKQDVSGNTDGMDMALCMFDTKDKILHFSGAVNPLIYIQNGQLEVLKGDFFGIGGQMKADGRKFSEVSLKIESETTCYIFSDGFIDQFGGPDGRKYFLKNFKTLLLDIHKKTMYEQKNILEQTLTQWLGNKYSRVDDVLIIGFKINNI